MLNSLKNLRYQRKQVFRTIRGYLSDNFKCDEAWVARLSSPCMNNLNIDAYQIEQRFHNNNASAIDVDIFVNAVTDAGHTEEITGLLRKLRLTAKTSDMLESTGHAVIRYLLDNEQISEIINILNDRLTYGVFLDDYMACYLMDTLVERKNFKAAAQIATFIMMQEDFEDKLVASLALYSCYQYLKNPEPFYETPESPDSDKDEVKVRVKFLRNEFYDDHFDITDHNHLVGKTLYMIGTKINENIGKNMCLLGAVLYQRYEDANRIIDTSKDILYKEILMKSNTILESQKPQEENKAYTTIKSNLASISANGLAQNVELELENLVKNVVLTNEEAKIQTQCKTYKEWCAVREAKLIEQDNEILRARRLEELDKLQDSMKIEEQKLWFFENEDKLDLQIDSKKVFYPKRWFGKKKKPRVVDEDYVPPEITSRK